MAGAPKRAPALFCIGGGLSPLIPQAADKRIQRSALEPQRYILRADALTDQARAPKSAKFAIASAVPAITAAATALETGRHPPVMVIAFVPTAVAIRHSPPRLERVWTLHIVWLGEG